MTKQISWTEMWEDYFETQEREDFIHMVDVGIFVRLYNRFVRRVTDV
jgi:hypothetical protein